MSPSRSACIEQRVEQSLPPVERTMGRVKLPQPDLKNITALTENLPNVPILPWNHYDNPQVAPGLDPDSDINPDTPTE